MIQKLNTTAIYILSVVGFLCCCFYGIGTIAAIIALVLANKELAKYNADPELYSNGKAMKTAKTLAIVSLVISLIGLAFIIWFYFNQCEFYEWYIEFALNNPGVTEEQLAPLYDAMEEAGCR
ncbi:CCC motif membrane protein [Nonlabens ulvanivorans]|uniref:CCC motif membrane protein n=1 Tax=Nonlabens ulvanivorans TaxID=906888 RepID=UPI0037C9E541